jgi:integrase
MRTLTPLLTPSQVAYALDINCSTLDILVHNGTIPHTYVQEQDVKELRFNPYLIADWMQSKPQIDFKSNTDMDHLRAYYKTTFPETIKTLKILDSQFSIQRKKKGYSLAKVPNKKYGFLYYVRYIENGKLIYSRWNTHTNSENAANRFAVENREKILREYHEKRQPQNTGKNFYHILNNYYKAGSAYFDEAKKRGRKITGRTQKVLNSWIHKVFVPFLRTNRVTNFHNITPPLIAKLQTELLTKGNNPKTINQYMGGIIAIFDHMVMNGVISENVFDKITRLKEKRDTKPRGCYEIDQVNGVFNRKWREEIAYFLNMIIYTTNMRNSEIEKIQPKDIIKIKDCHFIDIPESKSENGVRIVPLHPFAHEKLASYIKKYSIPDYGYLFSPGGKPNQSYVYRSAKLVMGEKLHKKLAVKLCDVEKYLDEQGITFYSGRYFWKTLMNANGLGDVEEYFMGHKVSNDVAKRYNRKDRVGQTMLLKKAKEVFKILDKWVFKP